MVIQARRHSDAAAALVLGNKAGEAGTENRPSASSVSGMSNLACRRLSTTTVGFMFGGFIG